MIPRQAVITAADWKQQFLPLQTMVDRAGRTRKVLGLLLDEITSTGIESIALIVRPGDEPLYRDAVDVAKADVTFIAQPEPGGYGHAILCAAPFVKDEPFLLMVSDHVYVSALDGQTCAQQLTAVAADHAGMVSAVQATHESRLASFGAVGGTLFDARHRLYQVQRVLEKPSPTEAEQSLLTPGLRHGYYLCFLGMHVLTPLVLELLAQKKAALAPGQSLDLSPSLHEAASRTRYLAAALSGRRYDLDHRHGVLMAQLAVALDGDYRDDLLAGLVELLAQGR
ncbi:MAG: sugar phosphate nucleotidyltransferase [Verrucomicrobiales bacterium]